MAACLLAMIFLTGYSVQDIRKRQLSGKLLGAGAVCAVFLELCTRNLEFWSFLGGVGLGVLMLGVSFVTREALGYGDGIVVAILGMFLGLSRTAEILLTAFLMTAIVSGILLAFKRAGRKTAMPFLPFLTGASVLCMIAERAG